MRVFVCKKKKKSGSSVMVIDKVSKMRTLPCSAIISSNVKHFSINLVCFQQNNPVTHTRFIKL